VDAYAGSRQLTHFDVEDGARTTLKSLVVHNLDVEGSVVCLLEGI
jgi:hypothetical protein